MNFGQLQEKLKKGVSRDDLAGSYGDYINSARREIANRTSLSFMRTGVDLVVPQGVASISLPADFKELADGRSPVVLGSSTTGTGPNIEMLPEMEVRRTSRKVYSTTQIQAYTNNTQFRAFLVGDTSGWKIGFPYAVSEAMPIYVTYFRYPAIMVKDSDTDMLSETYPELILDYAKYLAFSDVNDPISDDFEKRFDKKLKLVVLEDAARKYRGVALRM